MFQIPRGYHQYEQHPGNFLTHYGEIYPGTIMHCPNYDKGVFIVPNHHIQELLKLEDSKRTPEHYARIGLEIRDFRIISQVFPNHWIDEANSDDSPSLNLWTGEYKRMFVFGAAASKFCLYDDYEQERLNSDPLRPPLGTEIFGRQYKTYCDKYKGVLQSIDAWDLQGRDIEVFLEEQWQHFRFQYDPVLPTRHINIQFYLQELLFDIGNHVFQNYRRSNLYNIFIENLRKKSTIDAKKNVFVSFNYDTILDQYISEYYRTSFIHHADYINPNNPFVLLKPHGSANWGFKYKDGAVPHGSAQRNVPFWLFQNSTTLSEIYFRLLGGPLEMINKRSYGLNYSISQGGIGKYTINKNRIEIFDHPESRNAYFPALLMPYRDKDEFVMPDNHQMALKILAANVEELYLIGWKGNEELFNKQFSVQNQLKRIIIVNPESEVVKQHLLRYINLDKIEVVEIPTFKSFILERLNYFLNENN